MAVRVADAKANTLMPHVHTKVVPESVVYTDELASYDGLNKAGYQHHRIHLAEKIYVGGDVHTNTIEGFFSFVKRGINGVYHAVSAKHLNGYLNEVHVPLQPPPERREPVLQATSSGGFA